MSSSSMAALRLQRSSLIRITICRWGLVSALVAHQLLFAAEWIHFWHAPSWYGSLKLLGYGLLLLVLLVKLIKLWRAGKLFGSKPGEEADHFV